MLEKNTLSIDLFEGINFFSDEIEVYIKDDILYNNIKKSRPSILTNDIEESYLTTLFTVYYNPRMKKINH